MCLAHVLRFRCKHGLLMSIDFCRLGPCMSVKTTSPKLPQQPFRCYSCQQRRDSTSGPKPLTRPACATSISSIDSAMSRSSISSNEPTSPTSPTSIYRVATAPLPGVARQPTGTISYCQNISQPRPQSARPFSFTCSSHGHYCTPHYANLPTFLPHQNHPCPPCQFEGYFKSEVEDTASRARDRFPHLTDDMLMVNGRKREDWQSSLTVDKYVDEETTHERERWLHIYRKWTQDLTKINVLLSDEDGLGLYCESWH